MGRRRSTAKAAGDLLVVRKNAASTITKGSSGDIDAESCKFELDKEPIPVKRAKIEGIVYFHASAAEATRGGGHRRDARRQPAVARRRVAGRRPDRGNHDCRHELSLPLEDVGAVRLYVRQDRLPERPVARGRSNTRPISASRTSRQRWANTTIRRDSGFDHEPLRLDGKSYRKGLALASRTLLAYRLPGKFRQFKTVIGIDDSAGDSGNVRVEIRATASSCGRATSAADDAARELEIDVTGVKRLEIVVDYGGDLDIGDRLDLCDARVTK